MSDVGSSLAARAALRVSRRLRVTLLAASTLTVMSGATIAPSLPSMAEYFGDTRGAELLTRLVLTLPGLAIAVAAPFAGWALDRWGRKRLLMLALVVYGAAGTAGYVLDSLPSILASRVVLGLAVAALTTAVTTLIADYFDGAERTGFLGVQAACMGLGGVLFLTVAGVLAGVDWRLPFLVYLAAFGVLPFVAAVVYEPERVRTADHAAADVPAMLGPLVPVYAIGLVLMAIFYMVPSQLPFHIEASTGGGPEMSGAAIAVSTLFAAAGSAGYRRISGRFGGRAVVMIGLSCGLMGLGYLGIAGAGGYAGITASLAVGGVGLGFVMPSLTVWITAAAPEAVRGRALGGLTTALFLGQFLSPVLSQPLAARIGLGPAFGLAGGLLVAGALVVAAASIARSRGAAGVHGRHGRAGG